MYYLGISLSIANLILLNQRQFPHFGFAVWQLPSDFTLNYFYLFNVYRFIFTNIAIIIYHYYFAQTKIKKTILFVSFTLNRKVFHMYNLPNRGFSLRFVPVSSIFQF